MVRLAEIRRSGRWSTCSRYPRRSAPLANVLVQNGELMDAHAIADAVLQRDEGYAAAHLIMGQILARLGDKEAADAHLAMYLLDRLGPEEEHEPDT